MTDTSAQVPAVERRLGERTLPSGVAKVLTISQVYAADVADVWDACTNPERIPRWFLPVSGELKPGGHYQFQGNAAGTIEACDPPHSFAATWEFGGTVSWIEVTVTPEGDGRTRFTLAHPDEHWNTYGPGAVGIGWDGGFLGLSGHLSGAPKIVPAEAMAWMSSADGKRFYTACGEAWYAADVASGTDPATARALADAAIAAYTAPQ